MKTGHIRIKDKVYFEPDGLPEPNRSNYEYTTNFGRNYKLDTSSYSKAMKEYEASKQLIEVVNVGNKYSYKSFKTEIIGKEVYLPGLLQPGKEIKDNQPCKAEITGETCIIIELIK